MRCQISIEYISIVFGFLLLMTPLWVYIYSYSNSLNYQVAINYAQDLVDSVKDAAEFVYSQGEPATIPLRVHVPPYVQSINSSNGIISVYLNLPSGVSEIFSETNVNVSLSIPYSQGEYVLRVRAQEGYVNVSLY